MARKCVVPKCGADATRGDGWSEGLADLSHYRLGIELRLSVVDIAVALALCDAHAHEVTEGAWEPVEALLRSWRWNPLARD